MNLSLEKMLTTGKKIALTTILAGALIAGTLTACAKPAAIPTPTQASPEEVPIAGTIDESLDNSLLSIYAQPGATGVAMYVLVKKNSYGKELHNAIADLYLLDKHSNDFAKLSYKLPTKVATNSMMRPIWELKGNSKFESNLRKGMMGGPMIADVPYELAFILSDEGAFQINPNKRTVYLPNVREKTSIAYSITIDQDLYDAFKNANVPVPAK
jgi:hypothetical protein